MCEIQEEWESWEPLLLDDLKRFEHRIQKFYSAAITCGAKRKEAEKFVIENLPRLINLSVKG